MLDLRYRGKLDPDSTKLLNQISIANRKKYNDLITNISKPNKENIYWWVNEVSTRNTLASPFYHYYCSLHFINELIKNSKFNFKKIIVDSKSFKNVIDYILKKNNILNCNVVIDNNLKTKCKKFLKKYIGNFHLLLYNTFKIFIAKIFFKKINEHGDDLVLIDTFIVPGYTNSKRWYGSLWENLSVPLKNKTFFVLTIIKCSIIDLISIFYNLKKTNENYIIKETYLYFRDLKFAICYKKEFRKFKLKNLSLCGVDFSLVLRECINNPIDIYTIHESLLTYKFINRLKEKSFGIRLAIDWFEGQALDKAWNAGFKNYFPSTKTIGYRAFESYPLYLCSYPIPVELSSKILPDCFAVQGAKTSESIKEFLPNIKTILIPAFKAEYVWYDNKYNKEEFNNNILVALPISTEISILIIRMIEEISNTIINKKYNFIVKPHPTKLEDKTINKLFNFLPSNIILSSEKSFYKLLNRSDMLITEASSTCLEAISMGKPALIVSKLSGLFLNPVPEEIDKELYKLCSSNEDLVKNIIHFYNLSDSQYSHLKLKCQKVRSDYFEPVTKKGINKFLNPD